MDEEQRKKCAKRLRTALELADSGIVLQRAKLRRQHPDATDTEIESKLRDWLHHRPGAEHGDTVGRVVELPDNTP